MGMILILFLSSLLLRRANGMRHSSIKVLFLSHVGRSIFLLGTMPETKGKNTMPKKKFARRQLTYFRSTFWLKSRKGARHTALLHRTVSEQRHLRPGCCSRPRQPRRCYCCNRRCCCLCHYQQQVGQQPAQSVSSASSE
jgi:hypothetical protein